MSQDDIASIYKVVETSSQKKEECHQNAVDARKAVSSKDWKAHDKNDSKTDNIKARQSKY